MNSQLEAAGPFRTTIASAFGGMFTVVGCRHKAAALKEPCYREDDSLYTRLGGVSALGDVVDEFLGLVRGDVRVIALFSEPELHRLRPRLVQRLTEVAGGTTDVVNQRSDLASTLISTFHFEALVDDMRGALERCSIPDEEVEELLSTLVPGGNAEKRPLPKWKPLFKPLYKPS